MATQDITVAGPSLAHVTEPAGNKLQLYPPGCTADKQHALQSKCSRDNSLMLALHKQWDPLHGHTFATPTSPRYFCTNSEPTTLMKAAVVWWATALASIVLPVPGGPYNSTPLGGSMPICLYSSWWVRGSSTASLISCFWMSLPPMSCSNTAQVMYMYSWNT